MAVENQASPIPSVDTIDTVVRLKGGGAYYGLIVASPLPGDEISQQRLLNKIAAYIQDFYSDASLSISGRPTMENSRIHVRIHPESDPVVFELLARCRNWVEGNHIQFIIDTDLSRDTMERA